MDVLTRAQVTVVQGPFVRVRTNVFVSIYLAGQLSGWPFVRVAVCPYRTIVQADI